MAMLLCDGIRRRGRTEPELLPCEDLVDPVVDEAEGWAMLLAMIDLSFVVFPISTPSVGVGLASTLRTHPRVEHHPMVEVRSGILLEPASVEVEVLPGGSSSSRPAPRC
jgi:hypothetical protein